MDKIYSQSVQATRHKLPNTYTHIYTYSGPTHGEDHPRRSSLFENNENSTAAWCCTAGRGSAAPTQEGLWRLASHLAAAVVECRQSAMMINSFSICKKKKKMKKRKPHGDLCDLWMLHWGISARNQADSRLNHCSWWAISKIYFVQCQSSCWFFTCNNYNWIWIYSTMKKSSEIHFHFFFEFILSHFAWSLFLTSDQRAGMDVFSVLFYCLYSK